MTQVVGIGASAGGLEAVTRLLTTLPAKTGMSFVLVQHLDPERPSQLPEILSRATKMRVTAAVEGAPLLPNEILVAPPHIIVGVRNGHITLEPSQSLERPFLPIDAFFRALADEYHDSAVGIILSGTGSDGTAGFAAIKIAGGLTIAQDPASAQFGAMPEAAIAAGVDAILTPEEIGEKLTLPRSLLNASTSRNDKKVVDKLNPEIELDHVLKVLRTKTSKDFSQYKRGTVERRIRRRMALVNAETFVDYAKYLAADATEANALCEDILIKVTYFFREPESIELLKTLVFPEILQHIAPAAPIRIWVPGCATGEEAYSIAIVLTEFLREKSHTRAVQIFATDISKSAIATARVGKFGSEIAENVSKDRLERFFVKADDGYQIARTIRDNCVFSEQDVTKDPPFSRIDLISCRNLLIYLGSAMQRRVLSTFHFALNPSGYLLLGHAETIGTSSELFGTLGKGSKIFSRRLVASRTPDFASEYVAEKLNAEVSATPVRKVTATETLRSEVDQAIAAKFELNGVVIDQDMEILQFRGQTEPFLTHRAGDSASFNLFKMARDGLLVDLRLAIFEAQATNHPVRRDHLTVSGVANDRIDVNIEVVPFQSAATGQTYFVVLFEHQAPVPAVATKEVPEGRPLSAEAAAVARLQRELNDTREYLNRLIEKEQSSNEVLKTASEEILSSNEELQSTNEELQTAKEETQATNEELSTVNDELRSRNTELGRIHSDLINLVAASQISVLIFSKELTCRSSTSPADKMLNLSASPVGSSLKGLMARFQIQGLEKMVLEVIETLTPQELEVKDQSGRWHNVLIRPYLTIDNRIDGAAIALRDIDLLKTANDRLEASRGYANAIVATVPVPLLLLDESLRVVVANQAYLDEFHPGAKHQNEIDADKFRVGEWNLPELRKLLERVLPADEALKDFVLEREFKDVGRRVGKINARRLLQSENRLPMILMALEDVTEGTDSERKVVAAGARAETANQAKSDFLANMSHEIRTPLTAILGFTEILAADDPASSDQAHPLAKIHRNAMHLLELIDEILDLSKIEAGRLAIELIPFRLLPDLAETFSFLRGRAQAKGLRLDVVFEGPVPDTITSCPTRIHQILLNVIGNAIKFTQAGGVSVKIGMTTEGKLAFAVQDTGCGLTSEQQGRLFQPFGQADSSITRKYGGTGLGLNLSRRIAAALGGNVVLTASQAGKGSTFTITIDPGNLTGVAMRTDLLDTNLWSEALPPTLARFGPNQRLAGRHVLLAEDGEDNQDLITQLLEMSGAEVELAVNGQEAVEKAQAGQHDILLMDIQMPVMDGYEATRQLRAAGFSKPILALTAHAMPAEIDRCLTAGCTDFVAKPINSLALIDALVKYGVKKT